jgi:hypothetical protein
VHAARTAYPHRIRPAMGGHQMPIIHNPCRLPPYSACIAVFIQPSGRSSIRAFLSQQLQCDNPQDHKALSGRLCSPHVRQRSWKGSGTRSHYYRLSIQYLHFHYPLTPTARLRRGRKFVSPSLSARFTTENYVLRYA